MKRRLRDNINISTRCQNLTNLTVRTTELKYWILQQFKHEIQYTTRLRSFHAYKENNRYQLMNTPPIDITLSTSIDYIWYSCKILRKYLQAQNVWILHTNWESVKFQSHEAMYKIYCIKSFRRSRGCTHRTWGTKQSRKLKLNIH